MGEEPQQCAAPVRSPYRETRVIAIRPSSSSQTRELCEVAMAGAEKLEKGFLQAASTAAGCAAAVLRLPVPFSPAHEKHGRRHKRTRTSS
jgi:hypothetical protein